MIKKPIVFSLVREQSIFMTAIMSLLTFLSVLALGIALAIGTGVVRWNAQWDLYATVQIMDTKNTDTIKKIIDDNRDKITSVNEITTDQMHDLMRPWISGGSALENYLPQMYEIEFVSPDDLDKIGKEISPHARFNPCPGIITFDIGRVENDFHIVICAVVSIGNDWRMHFVHCAQHGTVASARTGNIKSNWRA